MAEVTDVTIVAGVPTAGSGTVPTLSKTNTVIGAVDETAPASDTASSGLNGRLQRIAQRITSLIGVLPASLGAKASSASLSVVPATDLAVSASATFTPAAASHVAGDCNGAAASIALAAPSGGRVIINSASIEIDGATAEATAWRLHLYNVTPPSATADDGVWDLPSGDRASYLGYIDLGTAIDLGSTQWNEVHGISKQIKLSGTGVFGYLVNLTTLTPANVAHIVTLHGVVL